MSDTETFVLELEPANLAKEVRALPKEVMWVLRLFDGERVLSEVVEESPLDVSKTLAVVQRGAELGLLRLGERSGDSGVRPLSSASKRWLEGDEEPPKGLPVESELEEELDEALARLGDAPRKGAHQNALPTPLQGLPQTLERSLKKALDRYLGPEELDKAQKEGSRAFGELERCLDEALQKPLDGFVLDDEDAAKKQGFTQFEEAFFDSYELDEEDEDFENLWVLGDEADLSPRTPR